MNANHGLPDNFKFIVVAAVFAATVSALIFGAIAVTSFKPDHNSGIFLLIPLLVAGLCGLVCMFQLPGGISAWNSDPLLRTRKALLILVVGGVLALFPIGGLIAILGNVVG